METFTGSHCNTKKRTEVLGFFTLHHLPPIATNLVHFSTPERKPRLPGRRMSAKSPLNIRLVQPNSHDSQSLIKTSSKTFLFQLRQPFKKNNKAKHNILIVIPNYSNDFFDVFVLLSHQKHP